MEEGKQGGREAGREGKRGGREEACSLYLELTGQEIPQPAL
jgi:hypothetical protein